MEFNWSIIAWIAGLIFVYLFGIWEGRNKGYKKRAREEEGKKKDQPAAEPEIKTVTETVTVTVDDPGLLRVKLEEGTYALDLDGTRVNPTSLLPEQRRRLIEIIGIMRPWLEGKPASAPAPTSAPQPASSGITPVSQPSLLDRLQSKSASSAPPAQTPPTALTNAHLEAPARPPAPPPPPAASQPQPAAAKPGIIAKEDRPAAPANSIVTQIDTVLQARLAGTPLGERGIFLTESSQGGVIVYIGLTPYNGIDEVPDPEIKAAIRAAITEWENKYTPGL